MIKVESCCRACLQTDCLLTPINSRDTDCIKFSDKLQSCVSELAQEEFGLPTMICGECIAHLRAAYDFRNVCLQSDYTLKRYIGHHLRDSSLQQQQTQDMLDLESSMPCITHDETTHQLLHIEALDNDCCVTAKKTLHEQNTCCNKNEKDSYVELTNGSTRLNNLKTIGNSNCSSTSKHNSGRTRPSSLQPYSCAYCEFRCRSHSVLKKHKLTHMHSCHHEKKFECEECLKSFSTKFKLTTHTKMHTGERPFSCTQCTYRCTTANHLKRHLRTHTGEKPFECNQCDKKFSSAYSRKRHTIAAHKNSVDIDPCM